MDRGEPQGDGLVPGTGLHPERNALQTVVAQVVAGIAHGSDRF